MNENYAPPKWINALLERLAPDHLAEEMQGDLHELFDRHLEEKGPRYARRKYIFNGLGFLAKSFFWKKRSSTHTKFPLMLGSYFKMAQRSLLSYKGNTIINVVGLAIAIASALVILTVIRFERSFDTFHTNADRIYRMVRVGGDDLTVVKRSACRTGISYPVPVAMKAEIPALENITSMEYFGGIFVEVPDKRGTILRRFKEERGCVMAEPSFFKVFDFKGTGLKWLEGNPEKALNEPFTIVLTKTMAKKYFPDGNALGRILKFEREAECKVTGVIEDLPPNTDFPFTIFISYASLQAIKGDRMNDWVSVSDEHQTFVVLAPGTTPKDVEKQIAKVHAAHASKEVYKTRYYLLQELRELHNDVRFMNYSGRTISRETIFALGLIALFLLLTGSINYINLATAQSTLRSKEIGLRKVMGSHRKNIILQFLAETFVVVSIAGMIALVGAEILLVNLQSLLNLSLTQYNFTDPFILLSLLAIVLVVTLFSGVYPSLVISRFNPISALKNKFTIETVGNISFRKILVVTQFSITQMLAVGTFIVVSQIRFFQNVDMGFNREAIITVNFPDDAKPKAIKVIEDQLRSQAFVSDVSFSSTLPSGLRRDRTSMSIGRPEAVTLNDHVVFEYQAVDPSYLDVYQIKLLAGRNLMLQDSSKNILVNKSLVRKLELGSPEEAVGKELKMAWGERVTVVGVVNDYYGNSMKEGADNVVLMVNANAFDFVSIKLNGAHEQASLPDAISKIEKIWTSSFPDYIFNYEFFDENIKAFYAQEEKYAQLFQLFSFVFLLIGCLGLYGLVTFVVNRKGKEIAIRKVLGATVSGILMMFSKEYVRLIIVSFLVAVPVAYYAVDSWFSNFTNHIDLHWWLFVIPGFLILVIALLVVATKTFRIAQANPVDQLKCE